MLRVFGLLLPAVFPSWRFFREVGPSPRIEMRADGGAWQQVMPIPQDMPPLQSLRRLLWSPHENERLFLVSLADRILHEARDHDLTELTQRLARLLPDADTEWFQFRLCLVSALGCRVETTSRVIRLAELRS